MQSVIVQYAVPADGHHEVVGLAPGEEAYFGRGSPTQPLDLRIDHRGAPRVAGRIAAAEDYWLLCNLSRDRTYVVENPEGAGEHVKVAPRRLGVPIPFEMARLAIPAGGSAVELIVFAPQHRFADPSDEFGLDGEETAAAFTLDETAKYFLVLVALCEPRLRRASSVALPGDKEIVDRLRPLPSCRDLSRSAVNFHVDYLSRVKLRLRDSQDDRARLESRRAELVSLALRFDLVRDDHLALLPPPRRR